MHQDAVGFQQLHQSCSASPQVIDPDRRIDQSHTRGLAFGGGPSKESLANDVIYLLGWPPVLSVHVLFAIALLGVYRYLKLPANDD